MYDHNLLLLFLSSSHFVCQCVCLFLHISSIYSWDPGFISSITSWQVMINLCFTFCEVLWFVVLNSRDNTTSVQLLLWFDATKTQLYSNIWQFNDWYMYYLIRSHVTLNIQNPDWRVFLVHWILSVWINATNSIANALCVHLEKSQYQLVPL